MVVTIPVSWNKGLDFGLSRWWGFLCLASSNDRPHNQEDQEDGQEYGDQNWQDQQEEFDQEVYKSLPENDQALNGIPCHTFRFPATDLDGLDGFFSDQGDIDGRKL
jgi:hypothetical protein